MFICSPSPRCTSTGNIKMTDLRLRSCENDFFSAPRFSTVILMNEAVTERGSGQHPAVIWCCCYEILMSFIHQRQLTNFARLINTCGVDYVTGTRVCLWNCIGLLCILNVEWLHLTLHYQICLQWSFEHNCYSYEINIQSRLTLFVTTVEWRNQKEINTEN